MNCRDIRISNLNLTTGEAVAWEENPITRALEVEAAISKGTKTVDEWLSPQHP